MEKKLKATKRDGMGKGPSRRLRAAGQVPGTVYGHGMDPVSVAVDARELYHTLHTEAGQNVLIDLQVGSKHQLTLPREIQRDHIKGRFVHVDFLAVRRDEVLHVDVPVQLVGESHGVKEGGVVEHHAWEVRVECLPADVPEAIEADITNLGIGDSLRVADLVAPPGATITSNPEDLVVSVITPPVLRVEEEVEELAEGEEAPEAAAEGEGEGEGAAPEAAGEAGEGQEG
jgi:large subunit ribosomal protein L25